MYESEARDDEGMKNKDEADEWSGITCMSGESVIDVD